MSRRTKLGRLLQITAVGGGFDLGLAPQVSSAIDGSRGRGGGVKANSSRSGELSRRG